MISEGSIDTEDWSNDAENTALTTVKKYILTYQFNFTLLSLYMVQRNCLVSLSYKLNKKKSNLNKLTINNKQQLQQNKEQITSTEIKWSEMTEHLRRDDAKPLGGSQPSHTIQN